MAAVAFAFLTRRASSFFPNAESLVGHDYEWFFPTLVVGHFWTQQNGWFTLPHFTPAMCGGVPFLANPQSVFFSIPQLLLWVLEPTRAMFATLLISAGVGAAGCYVLLRRYFERSVHAATLGGALFLLNGFLFYRMVVGHLTYHAIAVVPLLACVVASSQGIAWVSPRHSALRLMRPVVLGGLLIGYVSYGGALNFQIPALLTVTCTLVMLQIERGFRAVPWLVLAGSCLWGLLISAMKAVPAAVLVSQFPRSTIQNHLFQSPADFVTLLAGFFLPAALPDAITFASGWGLDRHEFEFGVSIVPLLLIGLMLRRALSGVRLEPRVLCVTLGVLLLIPIALTFGPWIWGSVLVRVPVINNNTVLVRWWALYLLPVLIITARCFDGALRRGWRSALLVCCIAVALVQEASYNPTYYVTQAKYDPRPVTMAYRQVMSGVALPRIERILRPPGARLGQSGWLPNDAFVSGASAWPCYEPLFGYHLELMRDLRLVDGPITLVSPDQRLNIVDPAAYFARPRPPGASWRFDVARLSQAARFADYRPYEWQEPWWHRASTTVTLATLLLSLGYLALREGYGIALLVRRRPRRLSTSSPPS